jgi:hypothetical protein
MELVFQFSTNRTLKIMTDNLLKKMYDDANLILAIAFSYRPNTIPVEDIPEIAQDADTLVNPAIKEVILGEHQTEIAQTTSLITGLTSA